MDTGASQHAAVGEAFSSFFGRQPDLSSDRRPSTAIRRENARADRTATCSNRKSATTVSNRSGRIAKHVAEPRLPQIRACNGGGGRRGSSASPGGTTTSAWVVAERGTQGRTFRNATVKRTWLFAKHSPKRSRYAAFSVSKRGTQNAEEGAGSPSMYSVKGAGPWRARGRGGPGADRA